VGPRRSRRLDPGFWSNGEQSIVLKKQNVTRSDHASVHLQDPQMRRDALNRHFQTPKITYEGIVRAFWQQQSQNAIDAQRKAAEKEAMEREMRLRAEQQRQLGRPDGHGQGSQQPRRF
jgi:hypothetical protein